MSEKDIRCRTMAGPDGGEGKAWPGWSRVFLVRAVGVVLAMTSLKC